MDLIWTIALLVVGYFSYNWYTGLQQQVREGRKPDDQVEGPEGNPVKGDASDPSNDADYIDYEEIE